MHKMMIYKVRSDGVFDGDEEVDVEDVDKSPIPSGYTRTSPHPIADGHHAIMLNGWKHCVGEKPELLATPTPEPAPAPTKEQLMAELAALTAKIQALE